MRDLADVHPGADRIRVVLDNLSTHSAGALYQTFPADQARRILRRLEFHYVPKHASWLNMVEIEIGVLAGQCLDRRIDSYARLIAETGRNDEMPNAPASTGCSQPKKPAPTCIQSFGLLQKMLDERFNFVVGALQEVALPDVSTNFS